MNGDLQIALLLAALAAAWRWGQWPERAAVLVILGAHALDRYYHWAIGGTGAYSRLDPGHLVIDLFMLASVLAIALKADRQWCLWLAGAQVVALLAHPVRLVSGDVAAIAYAIMIRAPSWLQIALIWGGIAFAAQRRNRGGWRSRRRWRLSRESAQRRSPIG